MKTLSQALRIILLSFILVSTTTSILAYDMKVDGVCYNINGNEASVTYLEYYNNTSVNTNKRYNYNIKYRDHITIPEKVTYNGLTYTVTSIGEYAFANCNTLKSISIPNSITNVGNNSFRECDGLANISIPVSVTSIGNYAFYSCDGLTSFAIPDSVKSIGSYSFYACTKMTNIVVGKSVVSIGASSFYLTPLAYITCLAETPPVVNSYDAFNNYDNVTLYVPNASIEAYRNASIWSNFKIITDFKPNYFSLDDVSTMHGDTIVVPVKMENENEITAFQTDLCLVNGFELVKNGDEYLVELSDRKGRDHVIMANETPDGNIRIASYSSSLKTFKNNEGDLFYVTIKVPDDGDGVYPIILKNTRLTTIDEDEVLSPDVFCNVTVAPFIKGDANESGEVTVTDAVVTAKYLLYQNPDPFNLEAADMNGDSKITITDVVKIAHLILDQDYDEPSQLRMMAPNMGGDRMSGENAGNTVSINLANEMEYTAMQMYLTLPEGMNASGFALTNRSSELGLIVKDRGNGKVRVLAYSPLLKTIKGNEGAVLTFNVVGAMGDIVVDRIELVDLEGVAVRLDAFAITANNPTALDEMNAGKTIASIKYFNLAGQQMTELTDGVNLVVTTYTDGTRTTSKVIH